MEVYEPREDSELLKKYIEKYAHGRVLDLGTGSGILALEAAKTRKVNEVVAADINPEAVKQLQEKARLFYNFKVVESDLFSQISGKFDAILFNPPYLPQDKGIEDLALYGGKKGWELLARFFRQASQHLTGSGQILIVFSSLTNKKKVQAILEENLFHWKELEKQKLPMFEELYVFLVKKSLLLISLEKKGIANIHYLTQGKRGKIFTGLLSGKIIAIKIPRPDSSAQGRISNEAKWLKKLNQRGIGPKLLFSGQSFLVSEFIEGKFILDWIKGKTAGETVALLISVLSQCFVLDRLKVNKEEMHHPLKHIVITQQNQPVLIDFERCYYTDKPHNVTQFIQFICRLTQFNNLFKLDLMQLKELAKNYKKKPNQTEFEKLSSFLKNEIS